MESSILKIIVSIAAAYCLGSISWAYVIGRIVRGIDMTEVGNGRIGTAFAVRQLGMGWGITVGVLDFFKGVAAVVLSLVLGVSDLIILFAAIAVVAGHNWSIFIGFKGGRGAATSFGVLAVLAPLIMLAAIVVLTIPFLVTRRTPFIGGIRRTTLLYGAYLTVILVLLWLDIALKFMPPLPWLPERSLLLVALPPCLMLLNLAGRPQARKRFDNQIRLG